MMPIVPIKVIAAILALTLAVIRIAFPDSIGGHIDTEALSLAAAAFLILILPWERLRTVKAAGIELVLDSPQVKGAISGLALSRVEDDKLKSKLRDLAPMIDQIGGARVLWIDDQPHKILAQRRLFRALGVVIVSVNSSDTALRTLLSDNDFDLLISDVQRSGTSFLYNNGVNIHEGVNFAVLLRRADEPGISSIPIIFYAGYEWERLERFTRPATSLSNNIEACRDNISLITKAVLALAGARLRPIEVETQKRGTPIAEPDEGITVEKWAEQKGFPVLAAMDEEDYEDEEDTKEGETEEDVEH